MTAAVGYIMLLRQESLAPGIGYFATFVIACGGRSIHPLTIVWLSNNGIPPPSFFSRLPQTKERNHALLTEIFNPTHSGWTLQMRSGVGISIRL